MRFIKLSAFVSFMLINAVLLLGVVSLRAVPVGPGGGAQKVGGQNGDVNGDGSLNVTDAVYLLRFLFSGGPQPVACAGPLDPDCCEAIRDELKALRGEIAARPAWPPRPEDMVTLVGRIASETAVEAFSVPADRWLVVTDVENQDQFSVFTLFQEIDGERTTVRPLHRGSSSSDRSFRSSTGIAFPPNSKFIIEAGGGNEAEYAVYGYLVDA